MRLAAATVLCALATVPAIAQDPPPQPAPQPPPEPTIAQGVKAGGVDLSGLTQAQAQELLTSSLSDALNKDFVVGAAGLPFTLTMAQAKLKFDAYATAKHALAAQPPAGGPESPAGGGESAGVDVPLVLS